MKNLKIYINEIASHIIFKHSLSFKIFISSNDPKDFQILKSKYQELMLYCQKYQKSIKNFRQSYHWIKGWVKIKMMQENHGVYTLDVDEIYNEIISG